MSTRPTREFTTSGGHVLVLNEYITGAENWDIRQIYIRGESKDAGATALEAEKKAIEIIIISIDARTESVADEVLKLPLSEYNEVIAQVTPVAEGKKK